MVCFGLWSLLLPNFTLSLSLSFAPSLSHVRHRVYPDCLPLSVGMLWASAGPFKELISNSTMTRRCEKQHAAHTMRPRPEKNTPSATLCPRPVVTHRPLVTNRWLAQKAMWCTHGGRLWGGGGGWRPVSVWVVCILFDGESRGLLHNRTSCSIGAWLRVHEECWLSSDSIRLWHTLWLCAALCLTDAQ